MNLRTRLFLLVAGVVAATVAAVTWVVSNSARQAFEAVDRQRTTAFVAQFRRDFARDSDDLVRRLERLAASDTCQRIAIDFARRPGEAAPFVGEAQTLATAQGFDFLDLVDEQGTIISSAHWPARFGYRHPWIAAAPRAEAAPAFLQAVEGPRAIELGLVAVRRVSSGLVIAGGRRLDEHFLALLSMPPGMRALLYRNVEPDVKQQSLIGASGAIEAVGGSSAASQLEALIARVRQNGREATELVRWPDGPELMNALPLAGRDGRVLGVLLIGSSGRELAALVSRIRWTGVLVGAGGILFGLIISYVIAARVTRPVEQLAEAAREVAAGNWNVQVDVSPSSGEVAALSDAFDSMTRQLADQRERLLQAERVAAWRELARRLAHELKNPLFPLRLTVDNLRRARTLPAGEFDEMFDESVGTLTAGLTNLNGVIAKFSDFARMPAPDFSSVEPNVVVEEAVRLFRAQAEASGRPPTTVVTDLDRAGGSIRADREQLGRVVQNLLLNAIDAMPNGGTLTVRTRRDAHAFRLEVADTGEGLTEEERQRLFTPYYTTKQHGTGLGLAIVQSVVSDHNGKVWVESAPGAGTTFFVELPV